MASQKKSINLYHIPVVNVIYDALFDETPTMEQINTLMGTFGLLNGLLVGVAAALMTIFSPEDADGVYTKYNAWKADEASKELLAKCPSSAPCADPYEDFLTMSNFAFVSLSSALLMLVLAYTFTAAIRFQVGDHHKEVSTPVKQDLEGHIYTSWWKVTRWLFIMMIALTALGLYTSVVAIQDVWVVQNGHTPQQVRNLTNRCIALDVIMLAILGVALPTLVMSFALIKRERAQGRFWMIHGDAPVKDEAMPVFQLPAAPAPAPQPETA